ncbi:hypothetical protein CgunFtcFv8_004628 [Champsocephalus gunnari]|uniref:Uncharacterized protein n=1 Tax=Champsocephalus gunnari TaxID=52237 RepID=A0AAN8HXQ9_CHAGU|nr:hypothetical protein CgunFtcFv8_004628 [Champsocephalus gunnari]
MNLAQLGVAISGLMLASHPYHKALLGPLSPGVMLHTCPPLYTLLKKSGYCRVLLTPVTRDSESLCHAVSVRAEGMDV